MDSLKGMNAARRVHQYTKREVCYSERFVGQVTGVLSIHV